ncbi:hypothetical protein U1Q18_047541 [Sarracenia purpurea var. burkii]
MAPSTMNAGGHHRRHQNGDESSGKTVLERTLWSKDELLFSEIRVQTWTTMWTSNPFFISFVPFFGGGDPIRGASVQAEKDDVRESP